MITKVALTAWKRLFPYLSDASQHAIAKDIRKPLAEYNKGVALGNKNIADKLGVTVVGDTGNSRLADIMTKKTGGAAFVQSNKRGLGWVNKLMKIPVLGSLARRQVVSTYGEKGGNALLKEIDNALARNATSADSLPTAYIRRSKGTAKDDFLRNTFLSHELSEAKHYLSHYKVSPDGKIQTPLKGVDLAQPAREPYGLKHKILHRNGVSNGHVSLGVLRDEIKGMMKSGYTDLHMRGLQHRPKNFREGRDFEGLISIRNDGEMGQIIDAGKDQLLFDRRKFDPEWFGDPRGLRTGNIKSLNKRFLRNMDKVQRAHNVANPTNKPSKVGTAPLYIL